MFDVYIKSLYNADIYIRERRRKADEIYGMILKLPVSIICTFEDNDFSEAARLERDTVYLPWEDGETNYNISVQDSSEFLALT